MAFTDYETEQLRKALLKETRHCAVTLGMKKTSVEQLTKAVGIAKGSFYKFYESKEMLFFAVLENVHSELYGVADHALSEANGLPPSERAAKAVLAVCRRLSDTGDMVFIEHDAKLLLQRLPEGVKKEHYHDDETHIRQLLEKYDLMPRSSQFPIRSRLGSCIRRCWKHWCTALAGSYLNKRKAAEMRLFQGVMVSAI